MRINGHWFTRSGVAAALALLFGAGTGVARADEGGHNWASGGHDIHNTHNAGDEHRIGVDNVGNLSLKWSFTAAGDISATPVVDGDDVYVPDWGGFIHRIDARTGKAVWSRRVSELLGVQGAVSRTSPAVHGDMLVFGSQKGAWVFAVRKQDGALLWRTQVSPHPLAIVTASPIIHGGHVYGGVASFEEGAAADPNYPCCSFRGSAFSLDLRTGQVDWQTYTVPDGYTGGSVWGSTPALDEKRHQLYVATGNNYSVPADVDACVHAANGDAKKIDACLSPDNWFDAVLALDLDTGAINWGYRAQGFDAWTVACFFLPAGITWCPSPEGPDYDFGSGPNLFTAKIDGKKRDLVGAGQKSGIYWALDPDTGAVVWNTLVGPGSALGGIEWGSAVDGERVYVSIANLYHIPYALQPSGATTDAGSFSALDAATGKILWQTPDPTPGAIDTGFVSVANGVMYAGSLDAQGHYYALDGKTGRILWSHTVGGSVASGAAISDGTIYWGSGYSNLGLGTPNHELNAFEVSR